MKIEGQTRKTGTTSLRAMNEGDISSVVKLFAQRTQRSLDTDRLEKNLSFLPSCVAEKDGQIVGFCYCYRFAPDIIELANIYVQVDHRNKGLGKSLRDYIAREAAPKFNALIAVNSQLHESLELVKRPTNFYIENGFHVLYKNKNTTIFIRDL